MPIPRAERQELLRTIARFEGRRVLVVGDLMPAGPFMIGIWGIEPEGNGTRYTATCRHWTEDACKQHTEMGFEEGWGACADQLVEMCEEV